MAPPPPPTAVDSASLAADALSRASLNDNSKTTTEDNKQALPGAPFPKKLRGVYDITKHYIDQLPAQRARNYEFEYLKPSFPDHKWAPLELVEVPKDKGIDADENFAALFEAATEVEHLNPSFGTILHGVSLAQLNDKQKDELARLVAFRGVVFFRGQDDLDIKTQLDLGRYYGPLHRHATTALPKGSADDENLLDVHVIWSDERKVPNTRYSQKHLWHSDVSYELQPPAYTFLKVIQGPAVGGDTLWTSGYYLYDLLSPGLQKYLEGLTATHSAEEQATDARRSGNAVRREPVVSEHPLVRTNPVTGFKSVYVNPGFTRRIVGVPVAESEAILGHLYELLATNVTHTTRWTWKENDVAVWDNRSTVHAASFGFFPAHRHAVRVTVTGEKPADDDKGTSQTQWLEKELNIRAINKDGTGGNYND